MVARGWKVHLATDDRAERFAGHFPAAAVHPIASSTFGSKNPISLARSFWTIWRGVRQASEVIRRIKPEVAVGFGGYPTIPPLYAATRRNVPTIVHEQNAVMGRANKALAAKAAAIAGGFLSEGSGKYADKTVVTGNPVRPAVLEAAATPYAPSQAGRAVPAAGVRRQPGRAVLFRCGAGRDRGAAGGAARAAAGDAAGARRRCRPGQGRLCRTRHGARRCCRSSPTWRRGSRPRISSSRAPAPRRCRRSR